MQYQKFKVGETFIEFHNSWTGEETVFVNGQVVSKIASVWGTHHPFTIMEEGEQVHYVLTSKLNGMQVVLDLRRNGEMLHENLPVLLGTSTSKPRNQEKKAGLSRLREYDLVTALDHLEKARIIDPDDPEIWFHMACAYSVLERAGEGFECLKQAVARRLHDTDQILEHEMLAFLRMTDAFEGFLNSNFTEYDEGLLQEGDA